jgi:hypothetical protein
METSKEEKKVAEGFFEVKKWNAVALWAWDIVVDCCAICTCNAAVPAYCI